MENSPIADWLKIFHIFAFALGLGSAAAKYVMVLSQRYNVDGQRAQASEELALHLTKKLESRALGVAWLLGLLMTLINGNYWTSPWLHAKMAITIVMIGVSHMSAVVLRRIAKARANAESDDRIQAGKTRLAIFALAMALLSFITFYLVIFRPF